MFGFIGKFKSEVTAGFTSIQQRLVTLEAKVEALFEHTKVVAAQDAAAAKSEGEAVVSTAEAVAPVAQAIGNVENAVNTVANDAKQV